MKKLEQDLQKVKKTTSFLTKMKTVDKNKVLRLVAEELEHDQENIMIANQKDIEVAKKNKMKESLIDRLLLDENRIHNMAECLRKVANMKDPIGEVLEGNVLENGLEIIKKRVPLGVVAIIYESRPNVTTDAFGLCFKAGNATVLRGGSDAIHTNIAIVNIIKKVLQETKVPSDVVYLVEDTNREKALFLMKLHEYIDVLIPRGGKSLIQSVVENSTIPVIETGTGNCHIYVDESADYTMGIEIILNAKTQRTGVCNACESLLVNRKIKEEFLPQLIKKLQEKQVEIRGDEEVCDISPSVIKATEEDWGREYLDRIISIKVVADLEEAIEHINKYSTHHSESIITTNYEHAQRFLNEIDSSCVYVNSSTRFTDGEEFGFGAEIGISTQKLHARGPMGLKELTTAKYLIYGTGQIRK